MVLILLLFLSETQRPIFPIKASQLVIVAPKMVQIILITVMYCLITIESQNIMDSTVSQVLIKMENSDLWLKAVKNYLVCIWALFPQVEVLSQLTQCAHQLTLWQLPLDMPANADSLEQGKKNNSWSTTPQCDIVLCRI